MPQKSSTHLKGYAAFLFGLKARIQSAQVHAALAVNRQLVLLYWEIGKDILIKQKQMGWGAKVIDKIAKDLHRAFPEMRGFSPRNLKYMRAMAVAYPEKTIVQQLVAQIPWGHNLRILDSISDSQERKWYICKTLERGWSRQVLEHQLESQLYRRQGQAITNFHRTLPRPQSNLAQQVLKDPYNFDFLTLSEEAVERDIEMGLLQHIREFLLELGVGFAYIGNQYHLEVGNQDYYLDLLFYHLQLRAFIVIELKWTDFKPEYAGKMNFYLSAVDNLLRQKGDHPSIGIILCKTKNKVIAEYALQDTHKPIGVSVCCITEKLPRGLKGKLPSVKELEGELTKRH